jgi:hypothetical protein
LLPALLRRSHKLNEIRKQGTKTRETIPLMFNRPPRRVQREPQAKGEEPQGPHQPQLEPPPLLTVAQQLTLHQLPVASKCSQLSALCLYFSTVYCRCKVLADPDIFGKTGLGPGSGYKAKK